MDSKQVQEKMGQLTANCDCGSKKKTGFCCKQGETKEIASESCPCGSGKTVKDCCMKE